MAVQREGRPEDRSESTGDTKLNDRCTIATAGDARLENYRSSSWRRRVVGIFYCSVAHHLAGRGQWGYRLALDNSVRIVYAEHNLALGVTEVW